MGKINVLDKHIAELIAAGEVVERPSSVIKELLENAIDAGAKNITVEIKDGGRTFMRVTDDGSGIEKDDIRNAFVRHATSKVKYEDDLSCISSLGFRGEALASISAVSRLQLITKADVDQIGTTYIIEGGEEKSFTEAGCPRGTTIIIRDIFFNTPARMKFLKKDTSEGNAISAVMDRLALSHPEISFNFIKESKNVLKTSGDGKLLSAIYSVYGRDFATSLIPIDYELNNVRVKGYISKPTASRPNRNMQNFFINGRFIKSRTASVAIEEACKDSVMIGKFPSCVIDIIIPFNTVDVNVHPAKIEVKFVNERPIFDAIYHGVKSALLRDDEKKEAHFRQSPKTEIKGSHIFDFIDKATSVEKTSNEMKKVTIEDKPVTNKNDKHNPFLELDRPVKINLSGVVRNNDIKKIHNSDINFRDTSNTDIKSVIMEDKSNLIDSSTKNISSSDEPLTKEVIPLIEETKDYNRFVGELFSTYIMIEKNDKELLLIDKHAAHERIIFEELKKSGGKVYEQMLLSPVVVMLDKSDYDSVVNNIELFKSTGFDVEDFGNGSVIVRSTPSYLRDADISDTIIEMASYISENKIEIKTKKMEWIYHNVACRAAIKAGNKSTAEELKDIASKVLNDDNIRYCPHGRPTCIVIKKYELEKQFGRV